MNAGTKPKWRSAKRTMAFKFRNLWTKDGRHKDRLRKLMKAVDPDVRVCFHRKWDGVFMFSDGSFGEWVHYTDEQFPTVYAYDWEDDNSLKLKVIP